MPRRKAPQPTAASDLGYIQCDWTDGIERCRYPGSLSTNTGSGGPWYCLGHYRCSDPIMGGDIVHASRDYQHRTLADIKADHRIRADAYCNKLGLTTVDEKRAYFKKMLVKVITKMTREPGQDEEEHA